MREARGATSAQTVIATSLILFATGCELPAGNANVRGGSGPDIMSAQMEAYDGLKARIAVTDFEDKVGGQGRGFYLPAYGTRLRDMLTT